MAVIKSGASTDQLTVDSTSKAARVTPYDASGNPLTTANGIKVDGSGVIQPVKQVDGSGNVQPAADVPGRALFAAVTDGANVLGTPAHPLAGGLYTDAGQSLGRARNMFSLSALNFTGATTEALLSLTPAQDYVNGSTATSFTVPAGKTLVILGISCVTKNAGAAAQGSRIAVRVNPSGAVTTSSPVVLTLGVGTTLATANVTAGNSTQVSQTPFGTIEIPSGYQIGISQIGTATAGNDVTLWGFLY